MHTNDPEPRSKKNKKKTRKHSNARWIVTIFFVAVLSSSAISFLSSSIMEDAGIVEAFAVLLFIVLLGIVFDVIGVAVTAADPRPFHSMAAHKVKGAKEALKLLKNASTVSSVCNDVVGDICGIVSGTTAAVIVLHLQRLTPIHALVLSVGVTALISGFTIGGKALGKNFAMRSSTKVVHFVGRVLSIFHK